MNFENIKVSNFEGAFRGMRNPKESWSKSDSFFGLISIEDDEHDFEVARDWVAANVSSKDEEEYDRWLIQNGILNVDYDHQIADVAFIGPNDMKLAKALIKGGTEHRKFLRQILVSVDITAPIFWYKEFDTYKIGTTANSTSTMHKLADTPITLECFEIGDLDASLCYPIPDYINWLEWLRTQYKQTKDKKFWKELIRWLPEGWLQTRTVTMNYENVRSMLHQRDNHKLIEWSKKPEEGNIELDSFYKFAKTLPYADDLLFE